MSELLILVMVVCFGALGTGVTSYTHSPWLGFAACAAVWLLMPYRKV